MENLVTPTQHFPIFISTEGATCTRKVTREPAIESDDIIYFYEGVVGVANYLYDLFVRFLQLFICCCSRPWPVWSWTTSQIVKDEEIEISADSEVLKSDQVFRNLIENATLPLNVGYSEAVYEDLVDELCIHNGKTTRKFYLRRIYHDNILTKTQFLFPNKTEICSFNRDKPELLERRRGSYISNRLQKENSLWISYADRIEFKREIVKQGLTLCGVEAVNGSTGHLEDHLLNLLEDTIFHRTKNGCTSVWVDPKSHDLELRGIIPKDAYADIQAKVEAFNEKQKPLLDKRDRLCRAELISIGSNDPTITDVILTIKRVDPSSAG